VIGRAPKLTRGLCSHWELCAPLRLRAAFRPAAAQATRVTGTPACRRRFRSGRRLRAPWCRGARGASPNAPHCHCLCARSAPRCGPRSTCAAHRSHLRHVAGGAGNFLGRCGLASTERATQLRCCCFRAVKSAAEGCGRAQRPPPPRLRTPLALAAARQARFWPTGSSAARTGALNGLRVPQRPAGPLQRACACVRRKTWRRRAPGRSVGLSSQ
jgi:hypothetical protein